MIKRNVKYFVLSLTILTFIFVWALKFNELNNFQKRFDNHSNIQAATLSSISLLQANYDINNPQGLSDLLEAIGNIDGVTAWQLLDNQELLLQSKHSVPTVNAQLAENSHVIYLKNGSNRLLTLKLSISKNSFNNHSMTVSDFIYILLFISCVILLGGLRFKWVYQLESYARYILANDNNPVQTKLNKSNNPISQAVNQLLLKNSLLLKDKHELAEQIRKISFVDDSTELGNQHFFKAEFEVRLHNHEEPESGLLMLISFTESEHQNNSLLDANRIKSVAILLKNFVAEIPNAIVARLKQSDFALLLPNQTREKTDQLCKSIIAQLEKTVFDHSLTKEHFVGIGISAYKQGFNYYKILAEADMALRNAQLQGGNSWFMYGESLSNKKVRGKIKWRSFLQRVLDKRQLQLFAQDIIYIADPTNHYLQHKHIEVFSRIQDGEEMLTADTFLPMANLCGLAAEFDRQVVNGVIEHYLYQSEENSDIVYSINLFISSLLDESFINWLIQKLSIHPKLCQQIYFEIKETNVSHNLVKLNVIFDQMVKLGIRWSIEKFGSPDEDQSFIDLLPISRVKIDRRIINNIHSDKSQQLFLQSLLINLKGNQIEVIADGVEKEADAKYLETSGITAVQGYYYARPERLIQLENYLRAG